MGGFPWILKFLDPIWFVWPVFSCKDCELHNWNLFFCCQTACFTTWGGRNRNLQSSPHWNIRDFEVIFIVPTFEKFILDEKHPANRTWWKVRFLEKVTQNLFHTSKLQEKTTRVARSPFWKSVTIYIYIYMLEKVGWYALWGHWLASICFWLWRLSVFQQGDAQIHSLKLTWETFFPFKKPYFEGLS